MLSGLPEDLVSTRLTSRSGGYVSALTSRLVEPRGYRIGKRASREYAVSRVLAHHESPNFQVGDHPFPIVSQPVSGLETSGGGLLRHAGKETPMARPVTGVFPQRSFPPRSPGACGNVVGTFLAKGYVSLPQVLGFPYCGVCKNQKIGRTLPLLGDREKSRL